MTAPKEIPVLGDDALIAKLQEVLQGWPLYRPFRYTGTSYYFVPEELVLFCPCSKCNKEQSWKTQIYTGSQKSGFNQKEYTCNNCGQNVARYYFYWTGNKDQSVFFKVGQYPPMELQPPARLAKKLNAVDADLYRKALTSRNNSYGLGALAYLRRVVENNGTNPISSGTLLWSSDHKCGLRGKVGGVSVHP